MTVEELELELGFFITAFELNSVENLTLSDWAEFITHIISIREEEKSNKYRRPIYF